MSKAQRKLTIKCFHINKVEFADKNFIHNCTLSIDKKYAQKCNYDKKIIKKIDVDIIKPKEHKKDVNNILDFIPISVKALGDIGEGITHTLTGVYVMLTCANDDGVQMAEFGSSHGILKDKVYFGRVGTPSAADYIIHFDVIIKGDLLGERRFPMAAHKACDNFIQSVRKALKELNGSKADEVHEYIDKISMNNKKVVLIKQVAGQGAMYDNVLLSNEPCGVEGGKSIIDMGNMPVILSPNEYRDGAIRAMT
ncbi:proline reductase cluster protein PrdD [Clostridiisalibacter paucivorans]|uniref:proline reductase cluster protein PrdD n=1 Tax=Clostridiisalibacter paucivorans TaxID=408753 RepID=UPI0004789847|nr:proline reductase cluster protein PrdD [Clostridiisalibacter paucivorans]